MAVLRDHVHRRLGCGCRRVEREPGLGRALGVEVVSFGVEAVSLGVGVVSLGVGVVLLGLEVVCLGVETVCEVEPLAVRSVPRSQKVRTTATAAAAPTTAPAKNHGLRRLAITPTGGRFARQIREDGQ
jgi:hypothetical protein